MPRIREPLGAALCAALLSLLASGSGCVQRRSMQWSSFDLVPAGGHPGRASFGCFESCSGSWRAVERADAPSPPHVLLQDGAGAKDDFNLALVTGVTAAEGTLIVRLRAIDGEIDQGGGLAWRAQSPRDYYLVRWNPLENNLRAYVVKDGVRRMLASDGVELADGWHTLAVTFDDERIEVSLDDRVMVLAFDHAAELPAGRYGVWTKADARTEFDDLRLVD
jgi:hypothetical protein